MRSLTQMTAGLQENGEEEEEEEAAEFGEEDLFHQQVDSESGFSPAPSLFPLG